MEENIFRINLSKFIHILSHFLNFTIRLEIPHSERQRGILCDIIIDIQYL